MILSVLALAFPEPPNGQNLIIGNTNAITSTEQVTHLPVCKMGDFLKFNKKWGCTSLDPVINKLRNESSLGDKALSDLLAIDRKETREEISAVQRRFEESDADRIRDIRVPSDGLAQEVNARNELAGLPTFIPPKISTIILSL